MDPLKDVLERLLAMQPDVPEEAREDVLRAGEQGPEALLALVRRRAGDAHRAAEEHARALQALIRRS